MATPEQRPSASKLGLHDWFLEGWFNGKTGELTRDFPIRSTDTVIDVGCGNGGFTRFCGMQGAEVIFIDSDPEKIEVTTEKVRDSAARAYRGILSQCDPIPLDDNTADVLICTEVLEHVPDPKQFLGELIRVTRPGGNMLITVPDARSEAFVAATAPLEYFQEPNHIRVYNKEGFRALIDEAGLEVVDHRFIGGFWSVYWPLAWLNAKESDGELPFNSDHPMVQHWVATWHEVQKHPQGHKIRDALNQLLPKSQSILCRKPQR